MTREESLKLSAAIEDLICARIEKERAVSSWFVRNRNDKINRAMEKVSTANWDIREILCKNSEG